VNKEKKEMKRKREAIIRGKEETCEEGRDVK
jgi:hypothetical protein